MSEKTNAVRILDQKKLKYDLFTYPGETALSGVEVAEILKQDPRKVFKTLVTVGKSGEHYVFLVPVAKELQLKNAAKAVGEKKIEMLRSADLLALTGYVHGGCSPIGMKKFFPTTIDATAAEFDQIMFSAGKIGYQLQMSLPELAKVIRYQLAKIAG